ncbi:tetratricopeptide repeat protein, partial [Flavobacterium sp.]|uniref:tetratricopeptide repeat protein n=1 Tax=Flavobacterium sp. TaxID=239 RepID=UPI00374DBC4F
MKTKYVIIAGALFISAATFAQKDELKTLKKIYAKETILDSDLVDYKKNAIKFGDVAIEESDKIYADFYKGMLPILEINALGASATPMQIASLINIKNILELSSGLNATLDFEKKSGKKIYTDDINETINSFKPTLWQFVIALDAQKKYKEVSQVAYAIYQLDKKDKERLFVAADYALRAEDYNNAIKLYNELNASNYTGEGTNYLAKNKANDQEDYFNTLAERDVAVKIGTHSNPRIEKTPSKRGEIYKNLAMAYIAKDDVPGAKKSISDARAANPDDTSLIITEANLYYKTNDLDMYKKL